MDITGLEGTEGLGKTGATQFHAWITNPFRYASCFSRSLASILRWWRSYPEALSPLSAKESKGFQKQMNVEKNRSLPTTVKIGYGPPSSQESIIRMSLAQRMSDGGSNMATTGHGVPGYSLRDMICRHD